MFLIDHSFGLMHNNTLCRHDTTIQQSRSGKNSGGMELDNKEASMEVSACDNNTYSKLNT